jgi:hypothetical protein
MLKSVLSALTLLTATASVTSAQDATEDVMLERLQNCHQDAEAAGGIVAVPTISNGTVVITFSDNTELIFTGDTTDVHWSDDFKGVVSVINRGAPFFAVWYRDSKKATFHSLYTPKWAKVPTANSQCHLSVALSLEEPVS